MSKPYAEILDLLQIPHGVGPVYISEVETRVNARVVTLRCFCHADNAQKKITRTLQFRQCEHMYWENFNHSPANDEQLLADILAIQQGTDPRGKFMVFVTDLFEIRIAFAEMIVSLK